MPNRDFVGDIEGLELHGVPVGLWNARQGGVVNVIGAERRVKGYGDSASNGCCLLTSSHFPGLPLNFRSFPWGRWIHHLRYEQLESANQDSLPSLVPHFLAWRPLVLHWPRGLHYSSLIINNKYILRTLAWFPCPGTARWQRETLSRPRNRRWLFLVQRIEVQRRKVALCCRSPPRKARCCGSRRRKGVFWLSGSFLFDFV